jgi:hypothetical protein
MRLGIIWRAGKNLSGGRVWPAGRSLPITALNHLTHRAHVWIDTLNQCTKFQIRIQWPDQRVWPPFFSQRSNLGKKREREKRRKKEDDQQMPIAKLKYLVANGDLVTGNFAPYPKPSQTLGSRVGYSKPFQTRGPRVDGHPKPFHTPSHVWTDAPNHFRH